MLTHSWRPVGRFGTSVGLVNPTKAGGDALPCRFFLAIRRKVLSNKHLRSQSIAARSKPLSIKDLRKNTLFNFGVCFETGKITRRYKYLNPSIPWSRTMPTYGYFIGDYEDEDLDDFDMIIFLDL